MTTPRSPDLRYVVLLDETGTPISGSNKLDVTTGGGGTSMTDDEAFTPTASSGTPAFFFADETGTDTLDEGDAGIARVDLSRRQLMRIVGATDANRLDIDASGHAQVDIAASSATVTVDASGTTVPVSNAGLTELAAAINSSKVDVNIVTDAAGLLTTAAHDAAFGTAGTADAQVRSIQGIAGMTPVVVDGSGVTQPVSNAGLTELAAAINASSQMDVNIAASGATVPVSNAGLTELAAAIDTEVQVDVVGSLPAGTNAIGKLAANSGVDIGDVDVTSIVLPRNLIGPGQPGTAIDSYTHAAFNLAAGANQVLVSSAASKQIWVYGIGFTVNVAGTVSFQDEDDTAITGIMQIGATGGMVVSPSGNFSMPIWKLGTDKDLEVDVVTSELDGWIDYAVVSV